MGRAQVLGGRIGGYRRWSQVALDDPERKTAPDKARAAFLARFADAPDPEAARKAYYAELALRSHQSRRPSMAAPAIKKAA